MGPGPSEGNCSALCLKLALSILLGEDCVPQLPWGQLEAVKESSRKRRRLSGGAFLSLLGLMASMLSMTPFPTGPRAARAAISPTRDRNKKRLDQPHTGGTHVYTLLSDQMGQTP